MKHPCFRCDLMTPTGTPPPSLSALTLPLLLHPLPDEAVGEGVFRRKPDDGGGRLSWAELSPGGRG